MEVDGWSAGAGDQGPEAEQRRRSSGSESESSRALCTLLDELHERELNERDLSEIVTSLPAMKGLSSSSLLGLETVRGTRRLSDPAGGGAGGRRRRPSGPSGARPQW